MSNDNSPWPGVSIINSVSAPCGQPLPGSSASSVGLPLETIPAHPVGDRSSARQTCVAAASFKKGARALAARMTPIGTGKRRDVLQRGANHTNCNALDFDWIAPQIDDDRFVVRISSNQFDSGALEFEAFDRN